ncbi:hypothetical protein FQR65_LT00091 [Abscondita terminalis]|nr:hypothetical protein FQR65_LT00091 [Abscondita terminalis]
MNFLINLVEDDTFREIIIFNHDTLKFFNLHWRKLTPYLNVIILNNLNKYETFLKSAIHLTRTDVVFFVVWNGTLMNENFWKWPLLKKAGNVVVYNTSEAKMSLYNVCYYCGNLSGNLKHLQTTTDFMEIDIPSWELQPRNFTNFYNHHFNIAYVNSFPNMYCQNSSVVQNETICFKAIGVEMEILKIFSKKLNFTYRLKEYKKYLNHLEADLNSKDAAFDFVIGGVSITSSRSSKMSFTSHVDIEPYTFLYIPTKARGSEFFDNIKPFKFEIWVIVLISIAWFSIVLYWSTKVHGVNGKFSLSACFGICSKAIIEQVERVNLKSINTQFSSHAILIFWWFASLIIATAYKSKLWAISIQNYNIEPSNLEQLLDSGYNIVVNRDNLEISEVILNNGDPLTIAAQKKIIYRNTTCGLLKYIIDNKAAILNEYGILQYHSLLTCTHILEANVYVKLRLTSKAIHHTTHSWPLEKGAVYKTIFNEFIGRIQTSGLKVKWKSDCLMHISNNYTRIPFSKTTTSYPDSDDKYFLKGFVSAFSIYILGNAIAIFCFIAEYHRNNTNKDKYMRYNSEI